MTDERLEAAIRETLAAGAPAAAPQRLRTRVAAIPATSAHPVAVRAWGPAGFLLAAAVLAILAILAGWRPWLVLTQVAAPNPLAIRSDFGVVAAGEITLTVAGRRVTVPASGAPGLQEASLTGSNGFGQLMLRWTSEGSPYTLLVHLAADARGWWISDAIARVGGSGGGEWLYFEGPWLEAAHGSALEGPVHADAAAGSATAGAGTLDIVAFTAQPPAGLLVTDAAAGPAFVPMRVGDEVVGYVPSGWREAVQAAGVVAQPPDQPVFAADLRTIVGWSQPGGAYRPLGTPR